MKKVIGYLVRATVDYCKWVSKQATALLNALFILTMTGKVGGIFGLALLIGIIVLGSYEIAYDEYQNTKFAELTEDLLIINGKTGEIVQDI